MHASMVHVWEYLTRCGHKFLWLKLTLYLRDIPVRYTERSLKFTARRAVFWSRLMLHRQQWVCSANNPRREPADKTGSCLIAVYLWIETSHHIMQNRVLNESNHRVQALADAAGFLNKDQTWLTGLLRLRA